MLIYLLPVLPMRAGEREIRGIFDKRGYSLITLQEKGSQDLEEWRSLPKNDMHLTWKLPGSIVKVLCFKAWLNVNFKKISKQTKKQVAISLTEGVCSDLQKFIIDRTSTWEVKLFFCLFYLFFFTI